MTRERAEEECMSISKAYEEGYERGKEDATKELPTSLYCDGFYDGYKKAMSNILGVDEFAKWLVKYKVVTEPAMNELLRDFKGEVGIENV